MKDDRIHEEHAAMDDVRSLRVFSWIAPVYGLFYQRQKRHYESVLDAVLPQIDLSPYRCIFRREVNTVPAGC